MTTNRSLAISLQLRELMRTDLLHHLDEDFPYELIKTHIGEGDKVSRDRIFNEENTLLTMLLSAIQEDKSLKQSVNIFKEVFESKGKKLQEKEALELQLEQSMDNLSMMSAGSRKPGRPKLYNSKIAKSKIVEISDNTAAYTKARTRLDKSLVDKVFEYSADFKELNGGKWRGMQTLITDGTYFQMQDNEELREKYYVTKGDQAYPQGLLQALIYQGSGQVFDFKIGTRHQSELELVKPLIEQLAEGSLLLADDLYNAYAVFCLILKNGCHLIVPGKKKKNYRTIRKIAEGDEIVELDKPYKKSPWMSQEEWNQLPKTIMMRRITFVAPNDECQECVQYTTILDEQIRSTEIILKYFTRWDIEITIREIKTLMGINIARSKTESMVFKEITIALTAYNMIRKIISKSVNKTDFSPQGNFVQECFEISKELLIDKKGRIYNHWSPGRYGKVIEAGKEANHSI